MDIIDRYHANRLWHINGNIIISGVFSAIVVATIVHLSEVFMWKNISHIVAFSAILDIILDPVIFFILHYKSSSHKIKDLSRSYFIKDAITIHGHKMVLSVVYYAMAAPLQAFFLMKGIEASESVMLAYIIPIIFTRAIHTWYGLKSGLFEKK